MWKLDIDRTRSEWNNMRLQTQEPPDRILAESSSLIWRFRDGMFGISRRGSSFREYAYTIRPMPGGEFEVLLDGLPYSESMIIEQTDSGFCAKWTRYGWDEPNYVERLHHIDCFHRGDA